MNQAELKELVSYCPETGIFTWKERGLDHFCSLGDWKGWNTKFANKVCGYKNTVGYVEITIKYKQVHAHRLAWLYEHGYFPVDQIDHINHVKNDNRIINLRACTNQENSMNQTKDKRNTSGAAGVHWHKRDKRWQASIMVKGKMDHLGYFKDIESAITARQTAEKKYGFHENHGQ
jgi:hypothetical protein